ncbi:MAG: RNA polymerase sigma factor [Steroidobacteraceae bacterium]
MNSAVDALDLPCRPAFRARKVARMASEGRAPGLGDDDAALMQAYAAGDLRAFERLYARHKGPLYRYLLRHTRDRALADDLFQEVWAKLIAARSRYESRAKFQTFLFTLAHNAFIDHCRRASVRPVAVAQLGNAEDDDPESAHERLPAPEREQPEQRAEQAQVRAALRSALDALPPEQRDVFLLYEEGGLSLEDIASVTGVGAETAKSRLRYAVAKLRTAMAPMAKEERRA